MDILVVEDDDSTRAVLREFLEYEGYLVSTACDGVQAIEVLKKDEGISLILLDLLMPRMNGDELLDWLRKDSRFSAIPVVVLSAWKTKVSGTPFIQKPVSIEELLSVINRFIGREAASLRKSS